MRRDVRRAPRDGDAIVRAVVRSGRHAQANKGGAAAARIEGKVNGTNARTNAREHMSGRKFRNAEQKYYI